MKEMKKLSLVWGIIVIALFSLLTVFGLKWKNKYKGYFELEDALVSKTKMYFESNYSYPSSGDSIKITLKELMDKSIIENLSYNDDKCTGYVVVKNNGVMEYKGYIKCDNYTTKGYQ